MAADVNQVADVLGVNPQVVSDWQNADAPLPDDLNNADDDVKGLARWLARRYDTLSRVSLPSFPQWVLNTGFLVALALCLLAFAAVAVNLFLFQASVGSSFPNPGAGGDAAARFTLASRLVSIKMVLLSTGVFAGAALGFLGLSLFLMGVRDSMNVDAAGGGYSAKLVNVAPGTLIVLCAILLIGICTTREFSITTYVPGAVVEQDDEDGDKPTAGQLTKFEFNVPVTLVVKLRETLQEAEDEQDGSDAQRRILERLWYLSDNMPALVTEYENSLRSTKALAEANKGSLDELAALKTCLSTISTAETKYGSMPGETLMRISDAVDAFEKAIAKKPQKTNV
ncbi:MAG: hypothetical protein RIC55_30785 [Pirellulaceae bacterium]